MIGNKIANRITNVSQWNISHTVTNEHDKETPKERYLSPEESKEFIDEIRLK